MLERAKHKDSDTGYDLCMSTAAKYKGDIILEHCAKELGAGVAGVQAPVTGFPAEPVALANAEEGLESAGRVFTDIGGAEAFVERVGTQHPGILEIAGEDQAANPDAQVEATNEAWAAALQGFTSPSGTDISAFIANGQLVDINQNPMGLEVVDGAVKITSPGDDGELGTEDDITAEALQKLEAMGTEAGEG